MHQPTKANSQSKTVKMSTRSDSSHKESKISVPAIVKSINKSSSKELLKSAPSLLEPPVLADKSAKTTGGHGSQIHSVLKTQSDVLKNKENSAKVSDSDSDSNGNPPKKICQDSSTTESSSSDSDSGKY